MDGESSRGQFAVNGLTGTNKVCSACRTVKCKCIPSESSRCRRCTRLDIECVFLAHRRGRRRKDGSSPRRKSIGTSRDIGHQQLPHITFTSPLEEPQQAQQTSGGSPPATSVYHDVARRGIFSIAGVMDDSSKGVEQYSPSSDLTARDDPVGKGILSMAESESLFRHYFDQLQTCVCLLDPRVHTAQYTRRAYSPLFASVLAVSSKFFRPELHENILAVADRLVSEDISSCVSTIELVQAICLLHYWKKPQDGRGWLRLGHAIRLGYQLDLHLPRKGPVPSDESAARLMIDRERTWISLFCFDSTATLLFDRPSMMLRAPDVASWIRSIPYPLPSDGQLEFAVVTSTLGSEVRRMQTCKTSFEILRSGLNKILADLHSSHAALTSDGYPVQLTSTTVSINKFSALAIQLLIECTLLFFAPREQRIGLIHSCISTSLDLLDNVVEGFGKKGIMPMIEDAHSVAVASTAVRLLRFIPYLNAEGKSSAARRLTNVVIVCREAARGDYETHPAYLARFIHLLLEKLHESKQPSRAPSPATTGTQPPENGGQPVITTTPDQWWNDIGQFAYTAPSESGSNHQSFWEGFPTMAGVINTVQPTTDNRNLPGDHIGTLGENLDEFFDIPWDRQWNAEWLGLPPSLGQL